jgi:hypothetical protein
MFPSPAPGTVPGKVPFALSSTHSGRRLEVRTSQLLYRRWQVWESDEEQKIGASSGSSWKSPWLLVDRNPVMTCFHDRDKNSDRKVSRFDDLVSLRPPQPICSSERIRLQFTISCRCYYPRFANNSLFVNVEEDAKILVGSLGQCIRPQFETFSRKTRGNRYHRSAAFWSLPRLIRHQNITGRSVTIRKGEKVISATTDGEK